MKYVNKMIDGLCRLLHRMTNVNYAKNIVELGDQQKGNPIQHYAKMHHSHALYNNQTI